MDESDERHGVAAALGVATWAAFVAIGLLWPVLDPLPERSGVNAPPFYGRWDLHDVAGALPAAALGMVATFGWRRWTNGLRTAALAAASGAASVAWALVLAWSAGTEQITAPFASRHAYLDAGADLGTSEFVRTYVDRLGDYPVHLRGHPPGMPLVLRALDAIGLGGATGAAIAAFAVWALGIAAVVWVVVELGGIDVARRASGAIVFLPAAVFVASSYDAFFAGAMAIATAVLVVAARRTGVRSDLAALVGGALVAGCVHLSYGLVPLGLIAAVVMVSERRGRPVLLAAVGFAAVVVAFVSAGFWWLDGLQATRSFYEAGLASSRPYAYFVVAGNPAALALCLGPAVAAGLGALLGRGARAAWAGRWAVVALAASVAVVVADVSGLSKAETERIWLPFMPWLAVAAGSLRSERWQRIGIGVSVALGVVLQVALVSPW